MGLCGPLSAALGLTAAETALADVPLPAQVPSSTSAPAAPPGSGAACQLVGRAEPPRNLVVYDAPSGGRPIARLTGGALRLVVSDLPANPAAGRSALVVDPDGFRISGYADVARLPLYPKKPLEVLAGHLWIGTTQALTAIAARTGQLEIQAQIRSSVQQTFSAWASCTDLSLEASFQAPTQPSTEEPSPRFYVATPESLELFAAPGDSTPLTSLTRSGWSDGIVFHSTETKKGFVHVRYDAEIVVDAWARARDLKAVPKGELVDQLAPLAQRTLKTSNLKLTTQPAILLATRALPVRLSAQKEAPAVGAVQPGTELYLIDRVGEWARVLPKSLLLTAPEGEPYWALAADLDAATKIPAPTAP